MQILFSLQIAFAVPDDHKFIEDSGNLNFKSYMRMVFIQDI